MKWGKWVDVQERGRKALFRNYTKGWKLIWQLFLIPNYSKCFSAAMFAVLCTPCPLLCFISQPRKNLAPFTDLKEHETAAPDTATGISCEVGSPTDKLPCERWEEKEIFFLFGLVCVMPVDISAFRADENHAGVCVCMLCKTELRGCGLSRVGLCPRHSCARSDYHSVGCLQMRTSSLAQTSPPPKHRKHGCQTVLQCCFGHLPEHSQGGIFSRNGSLEEYFAK